jgi:hypothetical protein
MAESPFGFVPREIGAAPACERTRSAPPVGRRHLDHTGCLSTHVPERFVDIRDANLMKRVKGIVKGPVVEKDINGQQFPSGKIRSN